MLRTNNGTLMIDDCPNACDVFAEERAAARLRRIRNEQRFRDMERIAAEVAERDDVIELAEQVEEAAMVELAEFGCIEFEL